jgi:hypothetical protein
VDNLLVFYSLSASEIWPDKGVAFGGSDLIKRGLPEADPDISIRGRVHFLKKKILFQNNLFKKNKKITRCNSKRKLQNMEKEN